MDVAVTHTTTMYLMPENHFYFGKSVGLQQQVDGLLSGT